MKAGSGVCRNPHHQASLVGARGVMSFLSTWTLASFAASKLGASSAISRRAHALTCSQQTGRLAAAPGCRSLRFKGPGAHRRKVKNGGFSRQRQACGGTRRAYPRADDALWRRRCADVNQYVTAALLRESRESWSELKRLVLSFLRGKCRARSSSVLTAEGEFVCACCGPSSTCPRTLRLQAG